MAKQTFSDIYQAYKELLDNDVRHRKNFHAFISHSYPSLFIQVMEAFVIHRTLDQEPIVHNSLVQDFAKMDIGSSISATKPSTWDEAAASSSFSKASGWGA